MAGNDVVRQRSEPRTAGSSRPGRPGHGRPPARVVGVARRPARLHRDRVGHPAEVASGDAEVQVPAVPVGDPGEPLGERPRRWRAGPAGRTGGRRSGRARRRRCPGSWTGVASASSRTRASRSSKATSVAASGNAGSPAWCASTCRTVVACLPWRGVRRPQVGHALVEAEGALGDRGEHGQRGERLGARVGHHQRVGGPRAGRRRACRSPPRRRSRRRAPRTPPHRVARRGDSPSRTSWRVRVTG